MKRISILMVFATLLLVVATCSMGAVHHVKSDFITAGFSDTLDWYAPKSIDSWYTIEPEQTTLKVIGGSIDNLGSGMVADYYLNDQTFIAGGFISSDNTWLGDLFLIKGSYLFDFGLFIGLEYADEDNDYSYTQISPGYRFSFDENSYLAFSFDYVSDDYEDEIVAYDVNFKYFTDSAKFFAQLYFPQDYYLDYELKAGANFQVSDSLVIGGVFYNNEDESSITAGLTYTMDQFIIDFELMSDDDDDNYFDLSGMFMITDEFGAGLGYYKEDNDDDAEISLKLKYENNSDQFAFIFVPENDSYDQAFYLTYTKQF